MLLLGGLDEGHKLILRQLLITVSIIIRAPSLVLSSFLPSLLASLLPFLLPFLLSVSAPPLPPPHNVGGRVPALLVRVPVEVKVVARIGVLVLFPRQHGAGCKRLQSCLEVLLRVSGRRHDVLDLVHVQGPGPVLVAEVEELVGFGGGSFADGVEKADAIYMGRLGLEGGG